VGGVTTTRISGYPANSNRLTGMTENGAALRTYTHDGVGNIVTDVRPGAETFAYSYNNRNRLASVTRNAAAYATYQYNGFEQLISRNSSAIGAPIGTVHYVYDLYGHLIVEADSATGASTREYIWLPSTEMHNDTPAEAFGVSAANDNVPDLPLAVINVIDVWGDSLGKKMGKTVPEIVADLCNGLDLNDIVKTLSHLGLSTNARLPAKLERPFLGNNVVGRIFVSPVDQRSAEIIFHFRDPQKIEVSSAELTEYFTAVRWKSGKRGSAYICKKQHTYVVFTYESPDQLSVFDLDAIILRVEE
jgi:YD repeat-containing protein